MRSSRGRSRLFQGHVSFRGPLPLFMHAFMFPPPSLLSLSRLSLSFCFYVSFFGNTFPPPSISLSLSLPLLSLSLFSSFFPLSFSPASLFLCLFFTFSLSARLAAALLHGLRHRVLRLPRRAQGNVGGRIRGAWFLAPPPPPSKALPPPDRRRRPLKHRHPLTAAAAATMRSPLTTT